MGNDAIVLWLSEELASAYFIAVIISMMGALQLVARYWQRDDLSWLPHNVVLPISTLMIIGAISTFYIRYYELIFVPGPAGLELMLLFSGATALAVWLTRVLHWLLSQ